MNYDNNYDNTPEWRPDMDESGVPTTDGLPYDGTNGLPGMGGATGFASMLGSLGNNPDIANNPFFKSLMSGLTGEDGQSRIQPTENGFIYDGDGMKIFAQKIDPKDLPDGLGAVISSGGAPSLDMLKDLENMIKDGKLDGIGLSQDELLKAVDNSKELAEEYLRTGKMPPGFDKLFGQRVSPLSELLNSTQIGCDNALDAVNRRLDKLTNIINDPSKTLSKDKVGEIAGKMTSSMIEAQEMEMLRTTIRSMKHYGFQSLMNKYPADLSELSSLVSRLSYEMYNQSRIGTINPAEGVGPGLFDQVPEMKRMKKEIIEMIPIVIQDLVGLLTVISGPGDGIYTAVTEAMDNLEKRLDQDSTSDFH